MRLHPTITVHYRRALADLGIPTTPQSVRLGLRAAAERYRTALRTGHPIESDPLAALLFWRTYNEALLQALGVRRGRPGLAAALADGFYRPAGWRRFPETLPVLRRLRRDGVRVGIVSNFTPALVPICDALGLLPLVDCAIASTQVGSQKPDVSIFRLALRRLGVDPAATLHVGDSYVADVLGARAAGITPVLVVRADRRPRLQSGDGEPAAPPPARLDCAVITDLRAVPAMARRIGRATSVE